VTGVAEAEPRPRLDVWVARQHGLSRHAAQALIASGAVRVNDRPADAARRVGAADRVSVSVPLAPERRPAEAGPAVALSVVFEDEHLAVVDKPAGLVVHPAPGHPHGTLADGLRQRGATWSLWGGEERPGIVHRLDRDTSGLLVVAKSEAAHRALAAQLERRSLTRAYWALVHGGFPEASGSVDAPIGRHPRDRKRMAVVESGRAAITDFRVIARHPRSSELDVQLRSGRTHQIRVHLAFIGHPVVGDPVYGRGRDGAARLALHARLLRFTHPVRGGELSFESALPPELTALREAAREGRL
jgi:23S rRNA pseudouridine1911/1915/1917 synthase